MLEVDCHVRRREPAGFQVPRLDGGPRADLRGHEPRDALDLRGGTDLDLGVGQHLAHQRCVGLARHAHARWYRARAIPHRLAEQVGEHGGRRLWLHDVTREDLVVRGVKPQHGLGAIGLGLVDGERREGAAPDPQRAGAGV